MFRSRGYRMAGTAQALLAVAAVALATTGLVEAQGRGAGVSPAAQRPPAPAAPQAYPPEQVKAGATLFAAQCGFCHGRDAAGGAGGTDLTRSSLVAEDVRGNRIGPVVRSGRPDRGMPAFTLSDGDLAALVAFIHTQQAEASEQLGGRRSVAPEDLQTGNPTAGRQYFEQACASCHSATGDLSGIGTRLRGLPLLQRMLYPGGGGRSRTARVTVRQRDGTAVEGALAYQDEFTIALIDADGWHRSWPTRTVTFTVTDPLQAHVEQLGKYTDADMHNVLAYLQSLR
jgi:cytochrome c oxidase cbb3-type subunit III